MHNQKNTQKNNETTKVEETKTEKKVETKKADAANAERENQRKALEKLKAEIEDAIIAFEKDLPENVQLGDVVRKIDGKYIYDRRATQYVKSVMVKAIIWKRE